MKMSDQINELATALCKAQAELRAAQKTKVNPHFKNKYADLDECWDTARPALSKHGLSVVQYPETNGNIVHMLTLILHNSGQYILLTELAAAARDNQAQSIGSAITYLRRYGFCAAVGITSDEDDDGNSAQASKASDKAREAVKQGEPRPPRADATRVAKMRAAFKQLKVPEETVLAHVGKKSFGELTAEDLDKLTELYERARASAAQEA